MATASGDVRSPLFSINQIRTLTAVSSFQLRRTGLYDFHVENGAKMVPFAGYSMPLSYGNVGASELFNLNFDGHVPWSS